MGFFSHKLPESLIPAKNRIGFTGGRSLFFCACLMLMGLFLLAAIGPYLTPFTYSEQILSLKNKPPGYKFYLKYSINNNKTINGLEVSEKPLPAEEGLKVEKRVFWFGSDSLGRDIFTRIWYGARISLAIGVLAAVMVLVLGTIYGGVAGYYGGWVDELMMRFIDILSSIPFILYVMALMLILEPGFTTIMIAIGSVYWIPMARLVRGQVMAIKEQDYVLAALSLGAGSLRIAFYHILPNALGPILVYTAMAIPEAIFTEAWLSFLGLGVAVPIASWGSLISDGVGGIRSYPWQLFFPAMFISLTMLAFNIIGDGLRDFFDPKANS